MRFVDDLRANSELVNRLFYLDIIVADETLKKWQRDMKTQRETLKTLEMMPQLINLDDITRELHNLSQGWYIHSRNLSNFKALVRFVQSASRSYSRLSRQQRNNRQSIAIMDRTDELEESLKYLSSSCQSLRYLVTDYRGRTTTQINLLFHLTNQAEVQANKEIAVLTADLTRKTQRDSTSMITIAAVTMFFLPGTFVASLLNSVFFSVAENGLNVSNTVWIFSAATIPLTILVFGIWLGWLRWKHRRDSAWRCDYINKRACQTCFCLNHMSR
ncbi:hypothetical protein F4677DRAFT_459788 [Hypoxylon crocopeplum]|nr:hypothetical protein F4677DRAFT_459788 [Hypoxylon crocopeplum]